MLSGGAGIPLVRVVIVVTINSFTARVDGWRHDASSSMPGSEPGQSTLTVKGKDLSALMDYLPLDGMPYPAMPPAVRVLTILAKYAFLGHYPPLVIPSVVEDIPLPIDRIPRQQGTDLQYIQQLARRPGYVFYVDPGPLPGASVAYWGPEIKVGRAAASAQYQYGCPDQRGIVELQLRQGSPRKCRWSSFRTGHESADSHPDSPTSAPLNPPLGLVPPLPPKITPLEYTAKLSPCEAVLHGLAYAAQHADALTGTGSLDVLRYGRLLKARQLVGVRGAGAAFDGLHYVKSVTHTMQRGDYKQRFTLSRNGLLSTVPRVPA